MVHVHGERDGFTSAALRGASTSASTTSDELPWNIIDVAMCVLHSAQAALQAPLPFHHGAAVILECGSCASILSTTALTPVLPVGFVNVSELGDSVRTCHSAFRQVTGTVATH